MQHADHAESRLLENLMLFARALRGAGLQVGPGTVLDAVRAVEAVGITSRQDFYWTLHAVFVNRRRDREIFDQAFHLFWRNPRLLERMMSLILPQFRHDAASESQAIARRLSEALGGASPRSDDDSGEPPEIEVDARLTWSHQEVLRSKDFEQMSADELAEARAAIARMRLPIAEVPTRRHRAHPRGERIDLRRTMASSLRMGSDALTLQRARRRRRPPPLVILCDISGSMSRYSRMVLHFMHTLTGDRERVQSFVFGTRLTNVTRYLKDRDVDAALARVTDAVEDWSGGTRIGECLHQFNRSWSRRVLAQGAVVLLITDGLDRDVGDGLAAEAERLRMSCRRLIWLNPLLRYERFEPRAGGMRALLPYVDDFRSVHNLDSLGELCEVLSQAPVHVERPAA